jgi:uncharacterized repeat protein (TIGR03803 family)
MRFTRVMSITALTLAVALVLGVGATQPAQARTFTVLYNFTGGADGGNPYAGLVRDRAGNLYGTTLQGGVNVYWGTVFKVTRKDNETVLYTFTGGDDGGNPYAGLVRDAAGNLYGTTAYGGADHNNGVVFKVDTSGTETVLHHFSCGDGCNPLGVLLRDKAGNLYGTTPAGGASGGVVFKVDISGTETVLYSFTGGTDGRAPYAGVIRDAAGNLYGTTYQGGSSGNGTVFKVDIRGTETVLHSFAGGTTDGCTPIGVLLRDQAGNLYGTTSGCGSSGNGVVFKVDTSGTENVLHSFAGGTTEGCNPYGGLLRDQSGNLYGTTRNCGASGYGTVFKLSKKGTLTLLHSFNGAGGANPDAGLMRDSKGNFYGTTYNGGSSDAGTVWRLKP